MESILRFLAERGMYLLLEDGFRIVDSLATEVFGGDGYLILENDAVRLRFTVDRGQMFLEFQPNAKDIRSWYSVDLVSELIDGRAEASAVFDERYAAFLRDSRNAIRAAFSPTRRRTTVAALEKLKKERDRRRFGRKARGMPKKDKDRR